MNSIRLPNEAHASRPWRIRNIAPDFTLEDVWALPVHGGAEDFPALLETIVSFDPANAEFPTRILFRLRERLGSWFGLDKIADRIDSGRDDAAAKLPIPGTEETSLSARLPGDLRNTAADLHFGSVPFKPIYRTTLNSRRKRRTRPCMV